jgi:hypothetical protein
MVACEETESTVIERVTIKSESLSEEEQSGFRTKRYSRAKSFTPRHTAEILKMVNLGTLEFGLGFV